MRFLGQRDYNAIVRLNQELVNDVVDTPVVIYKMRQAETVSNSYNEAPKKRWYQGVLVPCFYSLEDKQATEDMNIQNFEQNVEFSFLRAELQVRNVYPEPGDIINFNNLYYEIHTTNELQMVAGRTEFKHSIVCQTHLTRNTNLQLEPPSL
jgi:hypothetical protein